MPIKNYLSTAALLTLGIAAYGQEDNALLDLYKDQNAVMTYYTEHMVFQFEDGILKANSTVEKEMLLLSDQAPALYNSATVYHGSFNKLKDIEGATLIPGRNGYRTTKAKEFKTVNSKSDGIFYDDSRETVVTYTDLAKDVKTQLRYEIEHTDIHFLPTFYFQSYVPIAKATFQLTIPKDVQLKYVLKGNNTSLIKLNVEESKRTVTYTWTAENLPRFKVYDNAPDISYYMPHLIFYISSYKIHDEEKKVFGNVDDLYAYYYPFISKINVSPNPLIEKTAATITAGAATQEEKAKRIYQWVQQNIRYVAFEDGMGGFIPREAALVCDRKYGDCKDMASLLTSMCRAAGLNAYFTWIGTRDKPYQYAETPLPMVDNHMICTVNIDGKWIFMDGTDSNIPFGLPPYHIQGKEALIGIDKDHYRIIKVPEVNSEKNTVTDSTHIALEGKTVRGSVNIRLHGYGAWRMEAMMMYRNAGEKEDALKAIASRGSNKYIQKNFDYRIDENNSKDMSARSDFEVKDYAQQLGKEWYVNMNLLRTFEDNWIEIKDRNVPVENNYKTRIRQIVSLDIPKGYHVSYLPPAMERPAGELWGYKINYKNTGSEVQLVKEYEMNTLYMKPEQFREHNKLIEELKSQYKESIVLTADQ